jgi:SSS family solute:Na+ symporter
MAAGTFLVVREGFSSIVPFGGGDQPLEIYAGLVALLLNLTVAVAGTAALERLGVPRGADLTDLPSRLTVRRRPETGASNP